MEVVVGRGDGDFEEGAGLRLELLRDYTFYECNMNGANHLAESDGAPMHLCPVCLRKMQHAVGFDPRTRYARLEEFYRANGLEAEAEWVKGRREWIAGGE